MTWLSDRANAIRGIQGGGANTPNVTNSPDWLARRAEAQRSIIANQPKVVKTTKKTIQAKPQPIKKQPTTIGGKIKDTIKYGAERFKASIPTLAGGTKVGTGVYLQDVGNKTGLSLERRIPAWESAVKDTEKILKQGYYDGFEPSITGGKKTKVVLTTEKRKEFERSLANAKAELSRLKETEKKQEPKDLSKQLKKSGTKDYQKAQEATQKVIEKHGTPKKWTGKWLVGEIGGNAITTVGSVGLGIATTAVTKNPQIGLAVGMSNSFMMESGGFYVSAKEEGVSEANAQDGAVIVGTANAILETIPLGRALDKFDTNNQIKGKVLSNIGKYVMKKAKSGTLEGSTETVQELISNAMRKTYKEDTELFEGLPESFVVGFSLGLIGDVTTDPITSNMPLIDPESIKASQKIIDDALNTKPEARTPEQQEIVDGVNAKIDSMELPDTTASIEVEKLGKPVQVFRGTSKKGEAIDASKVNGLTKGESTSTDRAVAERFAKNKGGEVQEYVIDADATVINHSFLEDLVKNEKDMANKREIVDQFLTDNKIDVVRFDVPEGAKGEAELRIINPAVIKPGKVSEGSSMDSLLQEEGWRDDKQKKEFDTALFEKNATKVKELLPDVPQYYRDRFSKEIDSTLQAKKLADKNKELNKKNTAKVRQEVLDGKLENQRIDTPENIKKYTRGLPEGVSGESTITVYRASNEDIKVGDQVTTDETNANRYQTQREGSKVFSKKVKVGDLVFANGLKGEFVYAPKAEVASAVSIPELEKQMRDIYLSKQEAVDQAFSEIFAEMEIAEAGQRVFFEQQDSSESGIIGIKSSFPSWVPDELRSRDLFDKVMGNLAGDIGKLTFPDGNRSKQRELYNAILDEVDSRAGVDTSEARSAILDLYEKPIQKQEAKQASKPVSRSPKGREEATAEEKLEEKLDKYLNNRTTKFRFGEDVTTSILKELGDRETVSKQFILDLTNKGDIKQVEKDLIRKTLESYPDKVTVKDFKADVTSELLPLKTTSSDLYEAGSSNYGEPGKGMLEEGTFTPKYEGISLPDNLRGKVASYQEVIYESPIANSAGSVHFSYQAPNYFGHTRIEDMADGKTRRVIEVQSDLYQKGRLEGEIKEPINPVENAREFGMNVKNLDENQKSMVEKYKKEVAELELRRREIAKLQQYNNPTAHFRMVREEARKAFLDGKDTLLFPTGQTAMIIEGLVGGDQNFLHYEDSTPLKITDIKRGQKFNDQRQGENFIITKNLGDGNFEVIPLLADAPEILNEMLYDVDEDKYYKALDKYEKEHKQFVERASVSDGVDKNDPIYKFYEKDLARYLRSKYNATTITDKNGVTWNEVKITPRMGETVEAFRVKDDVEKITGKKITDEQEAEIIALNKRLFGDENVKITLQIMANRGALGSYKESIIQILDGQVAPKDTYYHEAVHKHIDIFTTRQEQTELFKAGIEKYGTEDLATVEEKIAEDFISYAKSREGVTGRIKSIFDSILARINAYLGNADAIDKLYQDILSPAEKKVAKATEQGLPVGQGKQKESAFLERVKEQLFFNDPTSFEFDEQTGKYNEMNLEENAQRATDFIVSNPKEAIAVSLGLINPPQGVTANAIGLGTMLKARDEKNFNLYRDIATSVTLRSTRLGQEIVSLRGQMNDNSPENFVKRAIDARMRNISKSLLKDVEVAGRSLSDTKKEVTKKIDQETAKLKKKLSKDQIKIQKAQDIIDALRC